MECCPAALTLIADLASLVSFSSVFFLLKSLSKQFGPPCHPAIQHRFEQYRILPFRNVRPRDALPVWQATPSRHGAVTAVPSNFGEPTGNAYPGPGNEPTPAMVALRLNP
jgi:hypothetical protein